MKMRGLVRRWIVAAAAVWFAGAVYAKHQETTMVIVNLTGADLSLKNSDTSGTWDIKPDKVITNGGTVQCKVHSDKLFSGHYIWVEYNSARGGYVRMYVGNTFASGNYANEANYGVQPMRDPETGVRTPLHFNRYGPPGHGDIIACTWVLAWEDLTKGAGIPVDQINQNMRKSLDALKAGPQNESSETE